MFFPNFYNNIHILSIFVPRVTWRMLHMKQELLTLPEHLSSLLVFAGVFCVMFCRSLFVLLSLFFCLLCCLSFDLHLLITPLVSSNFNFFLHMWFWWWIIVYLTLSRWRISIYLNKHFHNFIMCKLKHDKTQTLNFS